MSIFSKDLTDAEKGKLILALNFAIFSLTISSSFLSRYSCGKMQ